MKDDKIIEFVECNNNDSVFKIKMKSKVLYTSFVMMKFVNYDVYYIFVNYI